MRGKDKVNDCTDEAGRITPAYAGKRLTSGSKEQHKGDHPRVCGEKESGCAACAARSGSPPRMRGKALKPLHLNAVARDHPRVCGEKQRQQQRSRCAEGSPPRMRGKVLVTDGNSRVNGITPAYAGKRLARDGDHHAVWDHPRVCGEKPTPQMPLLLQAGSPPRMRGKVLSLCPAPAVAGITPAYAGKRSQLW